MPVHPDLLDAFAESTEIVDAAADDNDVRPTSRAQSTQVRTAEQVGGARRRRGHGALRRHAGLDHQGELGEVRAAG